MICADCGCKFVRVNNAQKRCVECADKRRRARQREWQVEKGRARQRERDRARRFARHGLTPEQAREVWDSQDGACAICREPFKWSELWWDFAFDHDHETGKFRGFLCHKCNQGLGSFYDRVESLRNAIAYLERAR